MAFFKPYYHPRPPPEKKKTKPEAPISTPRLLSRRLMPPPIIRRGPFTLIWENPDPPKRHDYNREQGKEN